jgi:hypothetical protein
VRVSADTDEAGNMEKEKKKRRDGEREVWWKRMRTWRRNKDKNEDNGGRWGEWKELNQEWRKREDEKKKEAEKCQETVNEMTQRKGVWVEKGQKQIMKQNSCSLFCLWIWRLQS